MNFKNGQMTVDRVVLQDGNGRDVDFDVADSFVKMVISSFEDKDDNDIKRVIVPLAAQLLQRHCAVSLPESPLPPAAIAHSISWIVLGITFKDWLDSEGLQPALRQEKVEPEEVRSVCDDMILGILNRFTEVEEGVRNDLSELFGIDLAKLNDVSLEDLPSFIEASLKAGAKESPGDV